jgi:hypothetical protein
MSTDRPDSNSSAQFGERDEERLNRAFDRLRKISKAWDERFTFDNPRFVQRYLKNSLQICVYIKCVLGVDPKYFCAVIQRKQIRCRCIENSDPHQYQRPMLVDIIQGMNETEGRAFPSFISMHSLDQSHCAVTGALYHSRRLGFVFLDRMRFFKNGELDMSANFSAIREHQLPSKMVKRRPKVMNNISDDDAPTRWWTEIVPVEVKHFVAGLRISLRSDRVTIRSVPECSNLGCEIANVFVGPLDLCLD